MRPADEHSQPGRGAREDAIEVEVYVDGEGEPPVVRADRPMTGRVVLRADEEQSYNAIRLIPEWSVTGSAVTSTELEPVDLDGGTVAPGDVHERTFEVEPPPGPYTFEGEFFQVDWSLRAEVDIDWAIDPSAEAEFRLEAGPRDTYRPGRGSTQELLERAASYDDSTISWRRLLGGLVCIILGGFMFWLTTVVGELKGMLLAGVVGLGFVAAGPLFVYFAIRKALAERALGDVEFTAEPQMLTPGDGLDWRLEFTPEKDLEVEAVDVELRAEERYDAVTNRNEPLKQDLHAIPSEVEIADARYAAGAPAEFQGRIEIPETDAYSFRVETREPAADERRVPRIAWRLFVEVETNAGPPWQHSVPVVVRPPHR